MNRKFFLHDDPGVLRFVKNILYDLGIPLPWIPGNKGLEMTLISQEWLKVNEMSFS